MITEQVQGITIFSIIVLFITLVFFFGRLCFGWFKGLSPIRYQVRNYLSMYSKTCPLRTLCWAVGHLPFMNNFQCHRKCP